MMHFGYSVSATLFGFYSLFSFLFTCYTLDVQRTCKCTLETESPSNHKMTCQMDELLDSDVVDYGIPCQQVNDLVRIGPIDKELVVEAVDKNTSVISAETVQLGPWAFTKLMWDQTVKRLQLDLQLQTHAVDALSLGGLENLEELLARTSQLRWDACSLAGMTQMRQMLLSCRSNYDEFLTLGPNVDVIRFVDCEETPMQFYCINCIQDPSINVIRMRPGPPLRQYMVKFSQFNQSALQSGAGDHKRHLSIGRCVPNICSDSMLCRDNEALQLAQLNVNRPTAPSTVTSSTTTTANPSEPVTNTTSDLPSIIISTELVQEDQPTDQSWASQRSNQTPPDSNIRPQYFPPSGATDNPVKPDHPNMLTRNQRIWIAASIVSVIAVFLVTACVLIGILRQRNRRQNVKFNRPRSRQTKYSNGFIRDRPDLIDEDEDGKLELPERVC